MSHAASSVLLMAFKNIWIRSKGDGATRIHAILSQALEKASFRVLDRPGPEMDLCISIGGDGTFLASLRELGDDRFRVPVLGIHFSPGRGFLLPIAVPKSESEWLQFAQTVAQTLQGGDFNMEDRWGLKGTVRDKNGRVLHENLWALNDMVVSRSTLSRLVWLKITVDGLELLSRLRGDGVIVSSSVGSTGYSLSAGGPIAHPGLKNILLTPVCPQTLAQRSVVLGENSHVIVEVLDNDTPSYLTDDGQQGRELLSGQKVDIQRTEKPVRFLVPHLMAPRYGGYFQILRDKLGFGGE